MGPLCRGPVCMPITPKRGTFCTPIHTPGFVAEALRKGGRWRQTKGGGKLSSAGAL